MTCISLDLAFDLVKLCDASVHLFHPYPKLHKSLLEVGWKRKANSKSLCEDHTHWAIEWIIRGTYFLLQNFQNLQKESRSKNERLVVYKTVLSCNRPRLEKAKRSIGNKKRGWIKCQHIQIKEEFFVIDMVLLKYNRHCSNSWSTNKRLNYCSRRARGKLGGLVGGHYRPNPITK
jgi:hypothetical protein